MNRYLPVLCVPMSTRDALLDVTARLYADHGWRGTTTRRIAEAAGVNEVTIFRQFGSKESLLLEAIRCASLDASTPVLPAEPRDLRTELVTWARSQHAAIAERRGLVRACLAEIEERPELTPTFCEGGLVAFADGSRYLERARTLGLIGSEGSIEAALVMLMNAIFMDAMTRDIVPQTTTLSATEAIEMFIDLILRALDAQEGK